MSTFIIGFCATVLFLWVGVGSHAALAGGEVTKQIVDAGNSVCPLTGQQVSGDSFVEYNGKRYKLCCPACEVEFKKDPEKYVGKMTSQDTCVNVDVGCTMPNHSD
jgi:YHS domain-containing protein